MKVIVKFPIFLLSVSILFVSVPAWGQWFGPDPVAASKGREITPDLSSSFRIKAEAVLDALDTLNANAGNLKKREDARQDMMELLRDLGEDNPTDDAFSTNIAYRAIAEYIESRYYDEVNISSSESSKSNSFQIDEPDYYHLSLIVDRECTKDLRLRMHGKSNPKCLDAVDRLGLIAPAGWVGPGWDKPGNSVSGIPSSTAAISKVFRLETEVILRAFDYQVESATLTREKQKSASSSALELIQDISDKENTDDELVLLMNIIIRSHLIEADVFQYNYDKIKVNDVLYKDNFSLMTDKACINDIYKRIQVPSTTDPECSRRTKELYHLYSNGHRAR